MALFRKKAPEGAEESPSEGEGFQPQPEKAKKWFDHAKSMADRYTYDSALFYYANGVKLDPEVMSAHEAMYEAAIQYANRDGKPAGKDIKKIDGPDPISKFAAAEYAWMKDIINFALAMKFLAAAVKANQLEVARWHAPRILNLQLKQKKQSKSSFIQAKDLFAEIGAWDQAIMAGEAAIRVDPTDASLEQEIKSLSAQRAMDQGGYEQAATQEEGGFRTMVKDLDKQQELVEAEALSGAGSSEERVLARAAAEFKEHPESPEAINRYAQLLKKQGTVESIAMAHDAYMRGYEASQEYRFRMFAGDVEIDKLRKEVRRLDKALEESPDDGELKAQHQAARDEVIELQESEYTERISKYPTDRHLKYALGEVYFDQGKHDDAMACFQAAKDEPKLRVRAGHMLGKCFAAQGWHMDANAEFDEALTKIEAGERARENAVRYDLMDSQLAYAREERSVELARDARENCSTITRRDITFRDIRRKRSEIETLIKELDGRA